jgi:Fe-S-cluster containining protein
MDLLKLQEQAKQKKIENAKFFKKLKAKKPKNLDNVVHDLHNKTFEKINCLDCANCCKTLGPLITEKDIKTLSKYLKIKEAYFIEQYLSIDEDSDYVFKKMPCPFLLDNNYCSVYQYRPKACREYPHTDRKKIYQLLNITEKNCSICPAVFQIVEELKINCK